MRRTLPLILILSLPVACSDAPKPEKATDLEKIQPKADAQKGALGALPGGAVATVNGTEIGQDLFREVYDLKIKKYTERGREIPPSADRRYRKSIAERLVYHEVLRQEAEAQGVKYDEKELAEREEQQKRGIKDWDKHLERRGETERSLREMYVAELREQALLDKAGKLSVTQPEIDEEYEKIKGNYKADKDRVRAAHILVPFGPETDHPTVEEGKADAKAPEPVDPAKKAQIEKDALAKAEQIHKQVIASGADFAAIAREQSTGPSARKGGDIGIFTADRMVEEFSDVAFKLKPGQISKPVKTRFGYHVIKVTGHWGPGELPKEALLDQIQERLKQRKLHKGRRDLKDELLAKYTIVDHVAATLGPEPEKPEKPGKAEAGEPADAKAAEPVEVEAKAGGEQKAEAGKPG